MEAVELARAAGYNVETRYENWPFGRAECVIHVSRRLNDGSGIGHHVEVRLSRELLMRNEPAGVLMVEALHEAIRQVNHVRQNTVVETGDDYTMLRSLGITPS